MVVGGRGAILPDPSGDGVDAPAPMAGACAVGVRYRRATLAVGAVGVNSGRVAAAALPAGCAHGGRPDRLLEQGLRAGTAVVGGAGDGAGPHGCFAALRGTRLAHGAVLADRPAGGGSRVV